MAVLKLSMNSIFTRLSISFFLVMGPVMVIGILIFSWGSQAIRSEIRNSASANVSFLQNELEGEVQNIKMLQYYLVDDVSLKNLLIRHKYVPKSDYYTLINNVRQRLQVLKNSNVYIQDVILYLPELEHTISADNGYLDFDSNEFEKILKNTGSGYPVIINGPNMSEVMPYPMDAGGKVGSMQYLLVVALHSDKLRGFLSKFSNYNGSCTALYDYSSREWLFSSGGNLQDNEETRLDVITKSAGKKLDVTANIGGSRYYVVSGYSQSLNFAFVQYVPMKDIFRVPDSYGYFIWLYTIFSIVIMLLYSVSTYRFVKYPINKLLHSFHHLEQGDLSVRVQLKASNEFNYLFEGFNKMVGRLNELIDRVYRQELYAKRSEYKQLQSQINPHFLFNSYFMLNRMVMDNDIENAGALSSYLGKYFQYITRSAFDDVTLVNEIEHARSYAQIQQMRFSDRLSVKFGSIPEKLRDMMVPRIILQPILENSLEHGLKRKSNDGLVRVTIDDADGALTVIVEDNGEDLGDDRIEDLQQMLLNPDINMETTGMINVHRRLILKFGENSGLYLSRSELGGLMVRLKIKY